MHIYGHLCQTTVWLGLGVCELLHLFLTLLVLGLGLDVYMIQPVVKPVVSCKQGINVTDIDHCMLAVVFLLPLFIAWI